MSSPEARARAARAASATVLFAALAGLLSACAGPTPYQPVFRGDGYAQQRIAEDRWRVTFAGNASTSRETVENYTLYRAAEVTRETGNDYFVVLEKTVEPDVYYTAPYCRYAYGTFSGTHLHHFGVTVPLYPYVHPYHCYGGGRAVTSYKMYMTIAVHEGERPDEPNAYAAGEVISALEGTIRRPPPIER